jgi:predicted ATPase
VRLSAFLGRDEDQVRLVEAVTAAPLVTVTGPGGIGKTRLVREAARDFVDRVTEEVVFAELAALPAGSDLSALDGELGFSSPEAAAVALNERSALLVLDNCEHIIDAVAEFVLRFLRASESARVIATSREPIGVEGERVFPLAPLDVPVGDIDVETFPAVQLFMDRSISAGADWERSPEMLGSIAELCRRLDGLPLAIELAAARTRALSPADLLASIDRRLELLQRPAARGSAARHDSVRAAIDTSVHLLEDEERTSFHRLGIFAGPFDADLAHGVIGSPATDQLHTLDLLGRLVDRSLIVSERVGPVTNFRLLELLRVYAAEALEDDGEYDDISERFVATMTSAAEHIVAMSLEGWSAELVARIAAMFHNLATAIGWSIDHDATPDRALRMFLPMFSTVHQSRSREVLEIGDRIFARWPDDLAPWRAEALAVQATAAVVAGDLEGAFEVAQASLADPDATGLARMVAERALGFATRARQEYEDSATHFSNARGEAASIGAVSYERELTGFVASVLDLRGEGERSLALLESAIDEVSGADDPINEAWLRLVRSTVLMRAERWDEARADTDHARATAESLLYPWWEGAVLRQLAILSAYQASLLGLSNGWPASVGLWRAAIENAASRGSVGEVALTLRAAAAVALRLGDDDTAAALLATVPDSHELTVMAELFPDEAERLDATRPARSAPDLPDALRLARVILVDNQIIEPTGVASVPSETKSSVGSLHRAGGQWDVVFKGRSAQIRDLKGLSDLAVLLNRPNTEVHCLELMGGAALDGVGPQLDDRARREYQTRIEELQREIDSAAADNDIARAERAELELDALVEQLSEAFGIGGRARVNRSSAERARTAVTYRIRAAIRRLDEVHPDLGRHLSNAIRTGTWCSYQPESDVTWDVTSR